MNFFNKLLLLLFFAFSLLAESCYYDNKEDLFQYVQQQDSCVVTEAKFTTDIVPLLTNYCNRCHNNSRQDGGVNLEGFAAVTPYVNDGSLYGTSNHEASFPVMPTNGTKIPFCELEKMRLWIEGGALNN